MNLFKKNEVDPYIPLEDEKLEAFCQEYIRLDLEERIYNKLDRRILAYRFSFPEEKLTSDMLVGRKASRLLLRDDVDRRIIRLYEELGTSVEQSIAWSRSKAEDALIEVIMNTSKDADRIKAIQTLNELRGIKAPEEKKETIVDSVSDFFGKLKLSED